MARQATLAEIRDAIGHLVGTLIGLGRNTDADNILRSTKIFYKRGDRTMLEGNLETAKMIIRQHTKQNPRMSLRTFVKLNREELSALIVRAVPNIKQPLTLAELEQWVLNDEGLYRWARSEGVRV